MTDDQLERTLADDLADARAALWDDVVRAVVRLNTIESLTQLCHRAAPEASDLDSVRDLLELRGDTLTLAALDGYLKTLTSESD